MGLIPKTKDEVKMSIKTLTRAKRPTTKAWVSEPDSNIDSQSLTDLQSTFGDRLNIQRGQKGETIIACQPQDKGRLDAIMRTSDQFSEQAIYADLEAV